MSSAMQVLKINEPTGARGEWKGRDVIFFLALATMMVPFQVTIIALFFFTQKTFIKGITMTGLKGQVRESAVKVRKQLSSVKRVAQRNKVLLQRWVQVTIYSIEFLIP